MSFSENIKETIKRLEEMDITVLTVNINDYDSIKEEQCIGNAKFILFTDNPEIKSQTWVIKLIERHYPSPYTDVDKYKILAPFFLESKYSIWMDGAFTLKERPEVLIDKYLKDADIAVFSHPDRQCLFDEIGILNSLRNHQDGNVKTLNSRYNDCPRKNGLVCAGFVIRRHTDIIKKLSIMWWKEVMLTEGSDQAPLNYCLWKLGIKHNLLGNYRKSPYVHYCSHNWHVHQYRMDEKIHSPAYYSDYSRILRVIYHRYDKVKKLFESQNIYELTWLAERIERIYPKTILEIGTFLGGWIYTMSPFFSIDAHIIGVDNCSVVPMEKEKYDSYKKTIFNWIKDDVRDFKMIYGNSDNPDIIQQVKREFPNSIDVIHIDGGHKYFEVKKDFENYYPLLKKGGLMIFHDIYERRVEVQKFWHEIKESKQYRTEDYVKEAGRFGIGVIFK